MMRSGLVVRKQSTCMIRSINPEKLWDDFYLEFLDELKSRGAWLPTAAGINHPLSYFEQIGGLIRAPGWDTYDEVKANMLGGKTRIF
jgi:hypothetical protein